MLLKDWVESTTIQSSKDQHKHTAAFRLNSAFQSIARDHLWSWLSDQFYFTTVPSFTSAVLWQGGQGNSWIDIKPIIPPVVGDISGGGGFPTTTDDYLNWTGAEIIISGAEYDKGGGEIIPAPEYPLQMRVRRIGEAYADGAAVYSRDRIYLDRKLPFDIWNGTVKVFRREYLPRSSYPRRWIADRGLGTVHFRDMPNVLRSTTRPTLQHLTRNDFQLNYGHAVESGDQVPQFYTMSATRRVPVPKFAPDVVNTVVAPDTPMTAGAPVHGTYYLACAYYDINSDIMSPLGPITQYEFNHAINLGIQVEYGTANGVPEESYDCILFISKVDPVGLDGIEINKSNRINERMVPFYTWGAHPFSGLYGLGSKGGGKWLDIPLDEYLNTMAHVDHNALPSGAVAITAMGGGHRYYPESDSQMVLLREIPNDNIPFCMDGKMKLPWFCDEFDSPPIPDSFQELVNVYMDFSIDSSAGANTGPKRGQYEFLLRKLKGMDLKRSKTSAIDPRYRGETIPRIDRYGLLE